MSFPRWLRSYSWNFREGKMFLFFKNLKFVKCTFVKLSLNNLFCNFNFNKNFKKRSKFSLSGCCIFFLADHTSVFWSILVALRILVSCRQGENAFSCFCFSQLLRLLPRVAALFIAIFFLSFRWIIIKV